MANASRDPDIADRIKALTDRGPSKVNPDVEKAMRGEKGKRPKVCPTCGEPLDAIHAPHGDDSTRRAELMDEGLAR
jgi:hypothetical protein